MSHVSDVDSGILDHLNRHGYSFQNAVLAEFKRLCQERRSFWQFHVAEFPVSISGRALHIDFILRHHHAPIWLVAECKRVNPSMARWCFASHSYKHQGSPLNSMFVDQIMRTTASGVASKTCVSQALAQIHDVGFEQKVPSAIGENSGGGHAGRGAINDASAQALRGANGFAEHLAANKHLLPERKPAFILPVIFTTAELWATSTTLSDADLATGNLSSSQVSPATRQPWLLYQHAQSPNLRHSLPGGQEPKDLRDALLMLYMRSIAVVSALGIEEFAQAFTSVDPARFEILGRD